MNAGDSKQLEAKWVIEPEAETALSVEPSVGRILRSEYRYPAIQGHGWVDRLTLSNELIVYQTVHQFQSKASEPMVPLVEFKMEFAQPTLSVHTLHSGTAISREQDTAGELVFRPGLDLFRYCEEGHCIPKLDTSNDIVMTALVVSEKALRALIGDDAAQQLMQNLGLSGAPTVRVAVIPQHVTEPLRQCFSSGSTGTLHILYAQSKVLEYLWKLATFTLGRLAVPKPSNRAIGTVRALHAYLTNLEGDMPTLKDLASKFGESPQSLNKTFMREYGQTIFSMLTSHRLSQAHKALTDSGVPIKTLAMRIGYSHVNHFTHAFKMKFGYTPGSLRRKPQDQAQ